MKNLGIGIVIFPFAWKVGSWRHAPGCWACQFGPFGIGISRTSAHQSGPQTAGERND